MKKIMVRSTPYMMEYINDTCQDIYDYNILEDNQVYGLIALTRIMCFNLKNGFPIHMKDSEMLRYEVRNITMRESSFNENRIKGDMDGLFYKELTRSYALDDLSSIVIRKFPAKTKIKIAMYPDSMDYQRAKMYKDHDVYSIPYRETEYWNNRSISLDK